MKQSRRNRARSPQIERKTAPVSKYAKKRARAINKCTRCGEVGHTADELRCHGDT